MIETLPETDGDLLALRVSGTLSNEDLHLYETLVKEKVRQYGAVRLYFEMKDFKGWEISSFLKNGIFDLLHGQEFNRVAMVGETGWQHLAAGIASLVKKKGIRYFDLKDKNEAFSWLDEDPDAKR